MPEIWKSNLLWPIVGHILTTSIEDAWYQALDIVMTHGRKYLIEAGSYEGQHRRTMPLVVEMHNPNVRPLAPLMPEGSNIPPPTTDEKIHAYMEYLISGEKKPEEHYTYGEDLSWQIEEVISYYKKHGFGSACCHMIVGRPEVIFFYNREVDYEENILVKDRETGEVLVNRHITNRWNCDPLVEVSSQCLRGVDVWVEDNSIHFWCYFRSQDLWGGFPENYGGLQLVKEYMASVLGIEDGAMIASSKDLHVYEHGWPVALMRIKKSEGILSEK
ncbi:MAG: hypothetical protein HY773_02515 [Candidatus Terrybacteria bacterium]|nr:hypothetical protein [Candidatus Terrybacteria bacterium]